MLTIQNDMMRFLAINELSETFKEQISLGSNSCPIKHTGLLGPRMRAAMPLPSRVASSPSFLAGNPLNVPIKA